MVEEYFYFASKFFAHCPVPLMNRCRRQEMLVPTLPQTLLQSGEPEEPVGHRTSCLSPSHSCPLLRSFLPLSFSLHPVFHSRGRLRDPPA
jgi:hypothetical protein